MDIFYNDDSLDGNTVSVKTEPEPRPESNPDIYPYVLPSSLQFLVSNVVKELSNLYPLSNHGLSTGEYLRLM
jgi:hypothetical protein